MTASARGSSDRFGTRRRRSRARCATAVTEVAGGESVHRWKNPVFLEQLLVVEAPALREHRRALELAQPPWVVHLIHDLDVVATVGLVWVPSPESRAQSGAPRGSRARSASSQDGLKGLICHSPRSAAIGSEAANQRDRRRRKPAIKTWLLPAVGTRGTTVHVSGQGSVIRSLARRCARALSTISWWASIIRCGGSGWSCS